MRPGWRLLSTSTWNCLTSRIQGHVQVAISFLQVSSLVLSIRKLFQCHRRIQGRKCRVPCQMSSQRMASYAHRMREWWRCLLLRPSVMLLKLHERPSLSRTAFLLCPSCRIDSWVPLRCKSREQGRSPFLWVVFWGRECMSLVLLQFAIFHWIQERLIHGGRGRNLGHLWSLHTHSGSNLPCLWCTNVEAHRRTRLPQSCQLEQLISWNTVSL